MSAHSLKCPSCHRPLSGGEEVLAGVKTFYAYCGYGPCQPSELGNEFRSTSFEEAAKLLEATYQEWLEAQPE